MSSTVQVRQAQPSDRRRWEEFTAASTDVELGHLWSYHELLADVFRLEVVRLIACRGPDWLGVLPLVLQQSVFGGFLTSVPYLNYAGVLGEDGEARVGLANEALALAERRKVDRLELRGRRGTDLPIANWPGKSSFVLDLPSDPEPLWKGIGSKVRSQVKRPKKEGYTTRRLGRGGHRSFYPLLARRWHELGSPVLPKKFFSNLEDVLADSIDYVLVEKDGATVAAGLIAQCGPRVEIPWAASAREHNRFGVNMLLYWAAIERSIERGASYFDYGRSTPGTGNARFKLQWGAREEALEWCVHAPSSKGRTSERGDGRRGLAAAIWRRLPSGVARMIGPRLAARIPL